MSGVLLFVLLQAAPARVPPDLAEELKGIKVEQAAIETAENDLTAAWAELAKKSRHVADTESLTDRGVTTYKAERTAWLDDKARHRAELAKQSDFAAEVAQMVANHNARCAGTYEDAAYVRSCNSEIPALEAKVREVREWGARLDAWAGRINSKGDALQKQQDTLRELIGALEKDIADCGARDTELTGRRTALDTRKLKLGERRNKALARLAGTDAVSKECADIAKKITADSCKPVGDPSDPANWNTPCEIAARCLQKAWDGAK